VQGGHQPRHSRDYPGAGVHGHGLGHLWQKTPAPLLEAKHAPGLLPHCLTDVDGALCGQRLQALGQEDGEALRGDVGTCVGAEAAQHHRAGMHSHPRPQLIGQGGHGPLQPQGRLQGTDNMILLGQGSPKERHQTLARALGDRARKVLDPPAASGRRRA
jgi:hypothetical protein